MYEAILDLFDPAIEIIKMTKVGFLKNTYRYKV